MHFFTIGFVRHNPRVHIFAEERFYEIFELIKQEIDKKTNCVDCS